MPNQVNVRTDNDHHEALVSMQEDGVADSKAEAMRQTSRTELARRGYLNGDSKDTALKTVCAELGKAFMLVGAVLVGITYFYPIELRLLAVGPIVSGLFLMGVERVLESHEPKITNALRGLVGGETA